jgi:hypothetical protein
MHFQGQIGIEAREGEHSSQIAKCLTARVRQSDFGRYSRLVSTLWLFSSLNAQIENALGNQEVISIFQNIYRILWLREISWRSKRKNVGWRWRRMISRISLLRSQSLCKAL